MGREARMLWEAARALNRTAAVVSPEAAALPPLLFFTDPARTPEPWTIAARLPAGAAVVYRAFGARDAEQTARRLREATAEAGVRLLIGLDADLAERCRADGAHLPEHAAGRAAALRSRRPDWVVTAAAHSAHALAMACEAGASAAIVSPVFTPGGASAGPALGVAGFEALIAAAKLPVYALGGIAADNAGALADSGACGLAAVDGVLSAFGAEART